MIPLICDEVLKVTKDVGEAEVQRARAQLKAGILMSLESTGSRCEQLARHLQIHGAPQAVEDIVAKVEAVDVKAVLRAAQRLFSGTPTFAAIGPLDAVEEYDVIRERLRS